VWVVSDTTASAADYEAVGVTWLIESASGAPGWLDDIRGVIDAGPGRPGRPPAGPGRPGRPPAGPGR
jgi:hypothetical protein